MASTKRSLLLAIFILFAVHAVLRAGSSDTTSLVYYLQKYELVKPELYIVTINTSGCQKCRVGLTAFNERLTKAGLSEKVVYVLHGLRPAEVEFYINNELSYISKGSRFIVSDKFAVLLDPKSESRICKLIGRTVLQSVYINNYAEISLDPPMSSSILTLKDSVLIDDSKVPLSNEASMQVLSTNEMVVLEPRYNRLFIFNMLNGKLSREFDLKYDYMEMFTKNISADPRDVEFASRLHPLIARYNRKEVVYGKLSVSGKDIYVNCNVIFYHTNTRGDTILQHYGFLLATDTGFRAPDMIYIPYHDEFYPMPNNGFARTSDSTFVFTMNNGGTEKQVQYLGEYLYDKNKKTLQFKRMLSVPIADFYVKNNIYDDFGPNDVAVWNDTPYFYFNWSIPFVYNEEKVKYSYPDTSYQYLTRKMWQYDDLPFELIKASEWEKGKLAWVTGENGNIYFSLMNAADQQVIRKGMLPRYYSKQAKYAVKDRTVYILKMHKNKSMLYTLALKPG